MNITFETRRQQVRTHGDRSGDRSRPGVTLIMTLLCVVGLFGLLALGIEIGTVAVARSQAQNAADSAAMAGARNINGDSSDNYNLSTAPTKAVTAAQQNYILGTKVSADLNNIKSTTSDTYTSGAVTIMTGTYGYTYNDSDTSKEGFTVAFPRTDTTEPYSAVRATVTGSATLGFANVLGVSSKAVTATAVAVHRPRDVFIIMDLSGSMRFQSLLGTPYNGSRTTSMNPDPDYPQFGGYSDTTNAALYGNSSIAVGTGEFYDPCNVSYTSNSGPPIIEDFYKNAVGVAPSSSNKAFTRGDSSKATTPGGDNYLKVSLNTGSTYAHTMTDFNNGSSPSSTTNLNFEKSGYGYYKTWNGYTEGPGYWGKTFFIWPPNTGFANPVAESTSFPMPTSLTDTTFKWHTWGDTNPRDWRQRFFVGVNTSSSNQVCLIQHNNILFSSSGSFNPPLTTTAITQNGSSVNYTFRINYAAILYWLTQSPCHFPSTVQAGRIRYYTAIPDGTDTTLNNRWWTTKPSALNNNERFWKDYIDFVLGCTVADETVTNYTYNDISTQIGNGDFYKWNGTSVTAGQRSDRPATPSTSYVNPTQQPHKPYATGTTGPYQTSTTGPYQSTTTTQARSSGNTTVTVNSLAANPVANTNYVQFGSTANSTSYKLTTNSKTTLTLATGLSGSFSSGAAAKIYSTNNAVNATTVSVNTLPYVPWSASDPNNDYIGFNNSTSQFYMVTSSTSATQLTLNSGLVSAVNLDNDSVQVYPSNGAVGCVQIAITASSLAVTPQVNDYIMFGTDTNQYVITNVDKQTNYTGYILTLNTGLVNAVGINGTSCKLYSPYMTYTDDVRRPKYHFWFGPMTWVDWLGNYNTGQLWWPGNVHEAQAWACKVGIQTAIDDIKNNHPNDYLGMTFFSGPMFSSTGSGHHNRAIVSLGRNYQQLKDSLWFPPSTVTGGVSEINPYSSDMDNVPRAAGSTAPAMGFMIAYNQLSNSATNLRTFTTPTSTYRGNAGGLGRNGAQRLIIFETDGVPNTGATATIAGSGTDAYYPIRIKDPTDNSNSQNQWPSNPSYADSQVTGIVAQICALNTASPAGYSTTRKPAYVYALGYGSLFTASNASTQQTTAKTFLQTVMKNGNTATTTSATDYPDWCCIYGTNSDRVTRMQTAFKKIMQTGTQVSLIE